MYIEYYTTVGINLPDYSSCNRVDNDFEVTLLQLQPREE